MIQVPIVSTYNAKGVNQATKSLSRFEKSVTSLGKSFAGVFAAQKVIAFGKASARAFADDQKSAALLTGQLKNLGLSYANLDSERFIKAMETQVHIADDLLRPAYAQLARVTGSIATTQKVMTKAFDIASGAGLSYSQTIDILSQAYVGNTKGLKQLNTGLSTAELKALSFDELLVLLNKHFKGEGAAALSGYTSKMDALTIATGNLKENIGGALLDSFSKLAGGGDIDKATSKMDTFGKTLAGVIRLMTGVNSLSSAFSNVDMKFGIVPVTKKTTPLNAFAQSPGDRAKIDANNAKLAKAKRDELAILTAKNRLTAAEAAAKADAAKLDEQKKKFDLERIGIAAGIAQKEDELAKTKDAAGRALLTVELDRLKLQQAILDENAKAATTAADQLKKAEADKLKGEIAAADTLAKLATNSGLAGSALGKLAGLAELRAGVATVVADTNKSIAAITAEADAAVAAAEAATAAAEAATASTTGTSSSTGIPGNSLAAQIGEEISPILTETPTVIAETIAKVIPDAIAEVLSPILTETPTAIAEVISQVIPGEIAQVITPLLTQIPAIIDDSLRPGDFKATNIADLPASTSGIDTQALADLFKKLNDFANGKDSPGNVTVTINDNTSGLVQIVADAVTDNNRYGNSLAPAGSLRINE